MRVKKEKYRTGEKALTPKQQELLLSVLDSYRDEVLIKLTLALGCRRADIVRIEWKNIDFEENMISYREKKKGDAIHNAYVSDEIMLMLKKYTNISTGRYLFPGEKGNEHLSDRTAYNIFNEALQKAGISDRPHPFHALRATCIKNCQRAGWKPAETARHVNDTIEVIQKHYEVPSMTERQQVARERAII